MRPSRSALIFVALVVFAALALIAGLGSGGSAKYLPGVLTIVAVCLVFVFDRDTDDGRRVSDPQGSRSHPGYVGDAVAGSPVAASPLPRIGIALMLLVGGLVLVTLNVTTVGGLLVFAGLIYLVYLMYGGILRH